MYSRCVQTFKCVQEDVCKERNWEKGERGEME